MTTTPAPDRYDLMAAPIKLYTSCHGSAAGIVDIRTWDDVRSDIADLARQAAAEARAETWEEAAKETALAMAMGDVHTLEERFNGYAAALRKGGA